MMNYSNNLTPMPAAVLDRSDAWKTLTSDGELFTHLQRCVQRRASEGEFQEMLADLDNWDKWQRLVAQKQNDDFILPGYDYQTAVARAFIKLAQIAVRSPNLAASQLQQQINESPFPSASTWDAYCALSGNPRTVLPGTQASLSVLLEQDGVGCLARLEIELIADGTSSVYPDPDGNGFLEFDAETFLTGAQEAWELAKQKVALSKEQQDQLAALDVRFRLRRRSLPIYRNPQLHCIEGRSAQAAFFLSLIQAAGASLGQPEAMLLNDSVAASATILPNGWLGKVGALPSKLEAAYLKGLAVVIVAKAGEAYEAEVRIALEDAQACHSDYPHVVEIAAIETVDQLLAFAHDRAKEREAVRRYEQEYCAKLKVVGRDDVDLATHYQELPLLRQVKRDRLPRDDRERDEFGRQPGEDKDDRFASLRGIELHRWEESLQQEIFADKQFSLDEVLANFRKVIEAARSEVPRFFVLGPPGSGKTTLVQYLAWRAANHDLKPRGKHLLPARVSLRLWERSNAEAKRYLPEYLAERYRSEEIPHPPTADHWRDWLRRGEVLLLLDGLDEINGDATFLEALTEALANYSECPTIITCRTVSFEQHRALTPDFPVFVLGAMNTEQRDRSIRAYAAGCSFDADALIEQLNRAPQMRALAANPLLLSLLCYAVDASRGEMLPVRRSELYDKTIEKLLTRPKRVPVTYPNGQPDIPLDRKRCILEQAALILFASRDQQRLLTFDQASLLDALTAAARQQGYGEAPAPYADALLADLLHNSGLLRGTPEQGYFFLHLTIQESLVAEAIARQINQHGWDVQLSLPSISATSRNFVDCIAWDRRYQEVVVILAGHLNDPVPLLDMLANKDDDDHVRHRLALAAQCLPEVQKALGLIPPKLVERIDRITSDSLCCWWKHAINCNGGLVPHLTRVLPTLGQVNGRVNHDAFVDRSGKAICPSPPGNTQQWSSLSDLILNLLRNEDGDVRIMAAWMLDKLGAAAATPDSLVALFDLLRVAESDVRPGVEEVVRVCAPLATPDFLKVLLAMLRDTDRLVQFAAAKTIKKFGVATTPELLAILALLRDADWDVRSVAEMIVEDIGAMAVPPEFLADLATLLRDEDRDVRSRAVKVVRGIGAAAATPEFLMMLASQLRDSDRYVQFTAAEAVVGIGAAAATPEFLAFVAKTLRDADWHARTTAAQAVRGIGAAAATPEFLAALAEMLSGGNWNVRKAAAEAIEGIGAAAATPEYLMARAEILRANPYERNEVRVVAATPEFLAVLAEMLRDVDSNVRYMATRAVREIGPAAAIPEILAALAELLRDTNQRVLLEAAYAIKSIGAMAATPEILAALTALLHHADNYVQNAVIDTVSSISGAAIAPETFTAIVALFRDSGEGARYSAATALFHICSAVPTPDFFATLITLLRDQDEEVRYRAAYAVGMIGARAATPEILEALAALLYDANRNVRFEAVTAVRMIGAVAATTEILAALVVLLRDSDQHVQSSAVEAIKKIGSAVAIPDFLVPLVTLLRDKDGHVKSSVLDVIRMIGAAASTPEFLTALIPLLHDADEDVRSTAVEVIWEIGATAATPEVLILLAALLCDTSQHVRYRAASAISEIGAIAATPEILSALAVLLRAQDRHSQSAALTAIEGIGPMAGTPEILSALAALLREGDWGVQTSAADAVRKIGAVAATPEILSALVTLLSDRDHYVRDAAVSAMQQIMVQGVRVFEVSKWDFFGRSETSMRRRPLRFLGLSKRKFIGRTVMELSDWTRK